MRLGAILLAAVLVGAQAPAWACAPPVSLPYANEQERQVWMWDKAEYVVLVRLVEIHQRDPDMSVAELRERRLLGTLPKLGVTLEPVRWLKGQGAPARLRMPKGGTGDCIPISDWEAVNAKVGDVFVAYFRPGVLSDETLIGGLAPVAITEPRAIAGLTKGPE